MPLQAQQPDPCGTEGFRSEWLKKYQANPEKYDTKSDDLLHIAMTIHRVGRNNGNAKIRETTLMESMCTLQSDFESSDIRFYLKEGIRQINDNAFHDHNDVVAGGLKMWEYNVENTINCYFVDDAAGNCGYNLPWAGVAVQEACANPDDHTWAHEMGHALKLPHPFLGWEGGVSHEGGQVDYNQPAPEFVTYNYTNFKDSLILDTMIIDTALVEKMDGSNCAEAADGFCDTKPDYLFQRWPCNQSVESFTQQIDPNGVEFNSDASLIMSYSFDNCASRFTDEQMRAMRANALDEKPNMTSIDLVFPPPTDPMDIELLLPFEDEVVYFKDVQFEWNGHQEDQYYLFQIGVEPTFSLVLYDTIVDQSSLLLKEADASWGRLYWRVRPFMANDFCTGYTDNGTFNPSETSSVESDISTTVKIYPTIIDDEYDTVFVDGEGLEQSHYTLFALSGQAMQKGTIGSSRITINTADLNTGIYILKIEASGESISQKLVVR